MRVNLRTGPWEAKGPINSENAESIAKWCGGQVMYVERHIPKQFMYVPASKLEVPINGNHWIVDEYDRYTSYTENEFTSRFRVLED